MVGTHVWSPRTARSASVHLDIDSAALCNLHGIKEHHSVTRLSLIWCLEVVESAVQCISPKAPGVYMFNMMQYDDWPQDTVHTFMFILSVPFSSLI